MYGPDKSSLEKNDLLAGNDTVLTSLLRGWGMRCTKFPLVRTLLLLLYCISVEFQSICSVQTCVQTVNHLVIFSMLRFTTSKQIVI